MPILIGMKLRNQLLLVVATAALATSGLASAEANWLTSFDEAIKLSKKSGKPILADFTGSDWCGWCVKLKAEVFDTPQFIQWAEKNVILLELDYPRNKPLPANLKRQNQLLSQRYGISGYPTILFLKADGSVIGKTGYVAGGPSKWVKEAVALFKG